MTDGYDCPFPWCGFEGTEDELREHVPDCGTDKESAAYGGYQ